MLNENLLQNSKIIKNIMKKLLFIALILFFILNNIKVYCQKSEAGVFLGGSYYIGDLNPYMHFAYTQPALGLLYRRNFDDRLSLRFNLMYGQLKCWDSGFGNKVRNLSFRSPIYEASTMFEITFLPFKIGDMKKEVFTTYVFGGFGIFRFNPQAEYNGTWYDLQPLGTEGQNSPYYGKEKYSLYSFNIPFGIGFKQNISKKYSINFEIGIRKTFTDYIDDVSTTYVDPSIFNDNIARELSDRSILDANNKRNNVNLQRGNSKNNDWYVFSGIMLTYKIKDYCLPCHTYEKNFKYSPYDR